ncbi:MAG: hypothetical protein Q8N10_03285 [Phenylobacterium sp.]|uniref:hypothetical protein n=1 Tax=Phenylobacterium sp. TaxID=1871053 RepID=UPI00271DBA02|nr:hypothetical protein [Phenylobacterium sp.]MDO8912293.1 hypothetical protein [Phenylobacterium sp.]MDP3099505.1 hypothetical protein [Phenylobacterium sp.]
MPTAPTPHTPLPGAPSFNDIPNFDDEAEAFVGAQETFGDQMDALATNAYNNAVEAEGFAEDTADDAEATAADRVQTGLDRAAVAADKATVAADKVTVQNLAAGLSFSSTSTDTVAIGTGPKSWTVQAGESYQNGMPIVATVTGDPTRYMAGNVTSYSGTTLTIAVPVGGDSGVGSASSWDISIGGLVGPEGPAFQGGSLTSAMNEAKATVASHATTADIWGAAGNLIDFTGTATVTAFPAAPQAGAQRRLLCAGACTFTHGANLILPGSTTFASAAGDIVTVTAVTTTQFRLTIEKASGAPVVGGGVVGDVIITAQTPADTTYKQAGLAYLKATYPTASTLLGSQPNQLQEGAGGSSGQYPSITRSGHSLRDAGVWAFKATAPSYLLMVIRDTAPTTIVYHYLDGSYQVEAFDFKNSTEGVALMYNGSAVYSQRFNPTAGSNSTLDFIGNFVPIGVQWVPSLSIWVAWGYSGSTNYIYTSTNGTSWTVRMNGAAGTSSMLGWMVVDGNNLTIIGPGCKWASTNAGVSWAYTGSHAYYISDEDRFDQDEASGKCAYNQGDTIYYGTPANMIAGTGMTYYLAAEWQPGGYTWSGGSAVGCRVKGSTIYLLWYNSTTYECRIIQFPMTQPNKARVLSLVGDASYCNQIGHAVKVGEGFHAGYRTNTGWFVDLFSYTRSTQFYVPAPSLDPGLTAYMKLT